jgi:hypothetical protein
MNISIFGYKFDLEILILIGIIYLILVGHTVCGCCNMTMFEGFDASSNSNISDKISAVQNSDISGNTTSMAQNIKNVKSNVVQTKANLLTQKVSGSTSEPTTSSSVSTEGFTGANINYGQSSAYDLSDDQQINTSSWSAPNMTVVPGEPLSNGVKQFLSREPQPVPLPEGELLMFANTQFKPECCPNTYSNSSGCACMTGNQYNYLVLRGGNNVPYSEY